VIDADGLNAIAGTDFKGRGLQTVLTPHPGEMARLLGVERLSESDRLNVARTFAQERNVCLVLKGYRTLIALPDSSVWINTTGSPAMATGGTGDILTGMIAGLIAQFPQEIDTAVRAAVWLHGRAGYLGAQELTEQCLIATDLLHYLPKAIREII
jgi:NAD(P)H-hydrate epimerase